MGDTDNDAFSSLSGYVRTDVTGDDFVDAADVSVDNNAFNAVSGCCMTWIWNVGFGIC
ncbi:MAG: hypothetical protein IPP52_14220 [Ignavibacteria bacterium]|nr:hypothetical protein [Ignavibacteria bacterium]